MNADQVRAIVAAKWPSAMQSPLAQSVQAFSAADEAGRAIGFAQLQSRATACEQEQIRRDAMAHALSCIAACAAEGICYDAETLSSNVETNFPELSQDKCDDIARTAIAQTRRSA